MLHSFDNEILEVVVLVVDFQIKLEFSVWNLTEDRAKFSIAAGILRLLPSFLDNEFYQ